MTKEQPKRPDRPNKNPVVRIETIEDALNFINLVNENHTPQGKMQRLYHAINNIDTEDFSSFTHEEKSRLIHIWMNEIEECKGQIAKDEDPMDDPDDPSAH